MGLHPGEVATEDHFYQCDDMQMVLACTVESEFTHFHCIIQEAEEDFRAYQKESYTVCSARAIFKWSKNLINKFHVKNLK